jgi:hypothetical protein
MPALQAPIYLNPWLKTELEGNALLVDKIPDLDDVIHDGVTCQKWLVRFAPDQLLVRRWLDYADAVTYDVPGTALSCMQAQFGAGTLTLAARGYYANDGSIPMSYSATYVSPHWYMPAAGRIRAVSAFLKSAAVVGTPPAARFIIYAQNASKHQLVMTGSNVTNATTYASAKDLTTATFAQGDHVNVILYSAVAGADSLAITHALYQAWIQFGTF